MPKNPSMYWQDNQKKSPLLYKVGKERSRFTSSSAPVERLLSIVGKVFICHLTDKRFAQLMCLLDATKTT